jgi:hypothetical protein
LDLPDKTSTLSHSFTGVGAAAKKPAVGILVRCAGEPGAGEPGADDFVVRVSGVVLAVVSVGAVALGVVSLGVWCLWVVWSWLWCWWVVVVLVVVPVGAVVLGVVSLGVWCLWVVWSWLWCRWVVVVLAGMPVGVVGFWDDDDAEADTEAEEGEGEGDRRGECDWAGEGDIGAWPGGIVAVTHGRGAAGSAAPSGPDAPVVPTVAAVVAMTVPNMHKPVAAPAKADRSLRTLTRLTPFPRSSVEVRRSRGIVGTPCATYELS